MSISRLLILGAALLLFAALSLIGGSLALTARDNAQQQADQYEQRLSAY